MPSLAQGWGRCLCGLTGVSVGLVFKFYLLKPPAAQPSLQPQLTVSGSAYRGCCGTLRCSVYLGKEVKCQTGQELCAVTPQEAAGALTVGSGRAESCFQAAEYPEGSCLHGSAVYLHCTEVLCSLFVSFRACFLTSLGATSQLLGHAQGPSLLMSC